MNVIIDTFQSDLLKALCNDEDEPENRCLISKVQLEPNYIELLCTHKFNYESRMYGQRIENFTGQEEKCGEDLLLLMQWFI